MKDFQKRLCCRRDGCLHAHRPLKNIGRMVSSVTCMYATTTVPSWLVTADAPSMAAFTSGAEGLKLFAATAAPVGYQPSSKY